MAPRTLTAGPGRHAGREPLFDVHPQTGATIEVFYADRHWRRSAGAALVGSGGLASAALRQTVRPLGPSHELRSAYRHAMGTDLGTKRDDLAK